MSVDFKLLARRSPKVPTSTKEVRPFCERRQYFQQKTHAFRVGFRVCFIKLTFKVRATIWKHIS